MGSKKIIDSKKTKRKAVRKSIEFKKELIARFERGTRVSDLAAHYGMPKSTISYILKNKDIIKEANVAKGVTALSRPPLIEELEKLLLVWINENNFSSGNISKTIVCKKAKELHDELKRKSPGNSDEFKASRGWFERFKRRIGIVGHGESLVVSHEADCTLNENKDTTPKFVEEFKNFLQSEGFTPQQVFKCYEIGLLWKKMPKTYIAETGYNPMKDRLTLLLCANASGDLKIKPLLMYHTENPKEFKKNNVIKSRLSVMWRANGKVCITRQFFVEWIYEVFAQSVINYLEEKNLPPKALLIMDNTPAHPPGLEEDLVGEYGFIQVKFFPPDATPLVQSMDQQIISNFKKLYIKALFQRCFEVTSSTELTLREFWKNSFNILHCLRLIDKTWEEVSMRTLNSVWKDLWAESVTFESFDMESVLMDDIVSLGRLMGLDVNSDDVEELVEDQLTTEELQEEVNEELLSDEEESNRGSISTAEINELCYHWEKTQRLVEKWHPDIAVVNRNINLFNDNVIDHFRKILRNRQMQPTLDVYIKQETEDSNGEIKTEPDVT